MTNIQKVIVLLLAVCAFFYSATYFINKDNAKAEVQVANEMYLEKMSKADRVIEGTAIYQGELINK